MQARCFIRERTWKQKLGGGFLSVNPLSLSCSQCFLPPSASPPTFHFDPKITWFGVFGAQLTVTPEPLEPLDRAPPPLPFVLRPKLCNFEKYETLHMTPGRIKRKWVNFRYRCTKTSKFYTRVFGISRLYARVFQTSTVQGVDLAANANYGDVITSWKLVIIVRLRTTFISTENLHYLKFCYRWYHNYFEYYLTSFKISDGNRDEIRITLIKNLWKQSFRSHLYYALIGDEKRYFLTRFCDLAYGRIDALCAFRNAFIELKRSWKYTHLKKSNCSTISGTRSTLRNVSQTFNHT